MDKDTEQIENVIKNIKETFGPGKRCLGKDWRMNFDEENLKNFVKELSPSKRLFLSRLISFFWYHMRPLYRLQDGGDDLDVVLSKTVWSTFALVTIMSVLDYYTKGDEYKRKEFVEFLSENLPITSDQQLKELSTLHQKSQPHPSIKRLCNLFTNNLDSNEVEEITNYYLSEERSSGKLKLTTFEDVINHLWGNMRSGFIHNVGVQSIYNESTLFTTNKERPDVVTVHRNLSMSNFLYLSWKAIFRDLGYKGEINPKFTEEEMRNRKTVDGTKI